VDPFLSGLSEHPRQESADSGLGLSNSYSLPQTPQDVLEESMDGVSEGGDMNSEDLLPTLLTDDLPPDLLLADVQSLINNKPDNVLTWL